MATLVHGGLAPTDISSAFMQHSDAPQSVKPVTIMTTSNAPTAWRWQSTIEPNANNFDWKFGAAVSIYERTIAIGPARDWDLGIDQTGVHIYTLAGQHWRCGCINEFTVQSSCKIFMLFRSFIVGENHCLATLMQRVRDCHSCHPKTKHQCCLLYTQRKPACRVKSAMKIATAVATQMPEMIQNRMMTVVSGQPLNSK